LLNGLTVSLRQGRITSAAATDAVLGVSLNVSGDIEDKILSWLAAHGSPAEVVSLSMRRHARQGMERWLLVASGVLSRMGRRAWPVLEQIAHMRTAPVELFVDVIARCPGVLAVDRAAALARLGQNPSWDVRVRVLGSVDDLPAQHAAGVLQVLANDGDDVADDARRRLMELGR